LGIPVASVKSIVFHGKIAIVSQVNQVSTEASLQKATAFSKRQKLGELRISPKFISKNFVSFHFLEGGVKANS
jgi:hypothetical protein